MNARPPSRHPFRCGYIALVGLPNVGKSTLFNALVGERLSIATRKPQTTRNTILGILNLPGSQILFLDTPGMLEPAYPLQEFMANQVSSALTDADVLLAVADASDAAATCDAALLEALDRSNTPAVLALNKSDLIDALDLDRALSAATGPSGRTAMPVSARTGKGVGQLREALVNALPEGPQLYPDDVLTEQPERFFVSELVREQVFTQLRQELPYATAVRIEDYKEDRTKIYIRATIVVERESQKGIVIGSQGRTLKSIGKDARTRIETFLEQPVYLDLNVKVQENWRKKQRSLRRLGYL